MLSVPNDKNVSVKEFEKWIKYKHQDIGKQKMWCLNVGTAPVIVGSLDVRNI